MKILFFIKKISIRNILGIGFLFFFLLISYAQEGNYILTKENKKINFGIGLGVGLHTLGIDKSNGYLNQETFIEINPQATPGFFINFISNYNFKKHWTLRSSFPLFHYSNYDINYKKNSGVKENFVFDHFKISLPIELLFKSDVFNDFRFYISLGTYSAYNFTTNVKIKSVNFLRINEFEQGATIGIGFMFGGEFTITSIEIKYQYGFNNIFVSDPTNEFANAIDKLKTRNLIFAINF